MSELHLKEAGIWGGITEGHWKEPPWDEFYRPPTVHYLTSSDDNPLTNVSIQTVLDTAAPDPAVPAIVVLKPGSTIGSTSIATPAVVTGDLTAYIRVIFLNYGAVEAAGGTPNSGDGGIALAATSAIEVGNYGSILSGGGAGGIGGGSSAYQTDTNCTGFRYDRQVPGAPATVGTNPSWMWHHQVSSGNTLVYFNSKGPLFTFPNNLSVTWQDWGGFRYFRGGLTYLADSGSRHYAIQRCIHTSVVSAPGQDGGQGQGYAQDWEPGDDKYPGEFPTGIGGPGGDGGDWSKDGKDGEDGPSGSTGGAGGAAGAAVTGDTNIHWLATGIIEGAIT